MKNRFLHRIAHLSAVCLAVALGRTGIQAATFTVTRTNISGAGSLPVVISQANATPGSHVIEFDVPGKIVLASPLPLITNNLTFNGSITNNTVVSGDQKTSLFSFGQGVTCIVSRVFFVDAFMTNGYGAAISNASTLIVSDCLFSNNFISGTYPGTKKGGGIFNSSTGMVTILSSLFSSNVVEDGYGGALYNDGVAVIQNSIFKRNKIKVISIVTSGGAIYGGVNQKTISIANSLFEENFGGGKGGAILHDSGILRCDRTCFYMNSVSSLAASGGAVYLNSEFYLTNCTFSMNHSDGSYQVYLPSGGAISCITGNTNYIVNCTVVSNYGTYVIGGGLYRYPELGTTNNPTIILNSIFAHNTAFRSPDLSGVFNSLGYNLIGNVNGATNLSIFDFQNEPANVGPLQDNGGPTPTCALLPGSIAIGGGTSAGAPSFDQRGVSRLGGSIDIGAYQTVARITPIITWNNPVDIAYGIPLSSVQLNAQANVPGSFVYSPPSGNVLNAGNGLTLQSIFTPTDLITYSQTTNFVVVNVLKADQTITFPTLPNVQLGASPVLLNGSSSSGLPITYTLVSGPANLTGNFLSFSGSKGTVTLKASQTGNTNFNPAAEILQSFVVGAEPLPIITTQPSGQTIGLGGNASFSVAASGSSLSYQWYFKGQTIPGAVSSTLMLSRVTTNQAGPYSVVVNSAAGSVASAVALLAVNSPAGSPSITLQPQSTMVTNGQATSLTVSASGSATLYYQWFKGQAGDTNNPIIGANGNQYTTPALTNSSCYWVNVWNSGGSVDSQTTIVDVIKDVTPGELSLRMVPGITIKGNMGKNYRIEVAHGVLATNWTTLTNIALPGSTMNVADWDATNTTHRFYRTVSTQP